MMQAERLSVTIAAGVCVLAIAGAEIADAQSLGDAGGAIRFSGDARMGVVWTEAPQDHLAGADAAGFRFDTRARLRLNWVQQTDSGISFGAQVELDRAGQAAPSASVTLGR